MIKPWRARSPFGERGEYPVRVEVEDKSELRGIPGIRTYTRGDFVLATYDATVPLARMGYLDDPIFPEWKPSEDLMPGIRRVHDLGIRKAARDYQWKDAEGRGALWLAAHAYAIVADPLRTGKTFETILALLLSGAPRKLIICPAYARLVWASEVYRWTKTRPLLLYGRGADRARPWHPDVKGERFIRGDAVDEALAEHEWTISNYELLVGHHERDDVGQRHARDDLPGWRMRLRRQNFEAGAFDEGHYLAGIERNPKKIKETRRHRVHTVFSQARILYDVTGTPIYNYVRDLFGQVDVISKGAVSNGPKHWTFADRYCDLHDVAHGGGGTAKVDTGESNLDELQARMRYFTLRRERSVILPELPPKQRRVHRLEETLAQDAPSKFVARYFDKLRRATFRLKAPAIAERVVEEALENEKIVVFVKIHEHRHAMLKAIEKLAFGRKFKQRSKKVDLRIQSMSGEQTGDARFEIGQRIIAHPGAAIIVATIDALQGAVSLRGVTSVHFADLHHSPMAMVQAEERSYEKGADSLAVTYHVVPESFDDYQIEKLLPRMRAVEEAMNDGNAANLREILGSATEEEDLIDIAKAMAARKRAFTNEEVDALDLD